MLKLPVTLSVGESKAPSEAASAAKAPPFTLNSADWMFDPPVAASSTVAVTVIASPSAAGLGAPATAVTTGARVSCAATSVHSGALVSPAAPVPTTFIS
jgi:hypothetical protein